MPQSSYTLTLQLVVLTALMICTYLWNRCWGQSLIGAYQSKVHKFRAAYHMPHAATTYIYIYIHTRALR
jgi:hypothetical protein